MSDALSDAPIARSGEPVVRLASRKRLERVLVLCLVALLVVGAFFLITEPRRLEGVAPSAEPTTPWLENGMIRYPRSFAEREQLSFAEVGRNELTPSIVVSGEVTWDPRRVAAIGARIEGRLRSVAHVEGERVLPGEVVAELESVELGQAQAAVLKARAREQVAKTDGERERRLADAKVTAERDAEHAAANAQAATAERIAAEKAVEALGGAVGGEMGVLRLRSPIEGNVMDLKVKRGETVEPTDTILVVADTSRVWVTFRAFERELGAIRAGDAVEISLPADRTVTLAGRIDHVSEVIDPESRAGHVRVVLDNQHKKLRPGQSVIGTINASGPRGVHLAVPRAAVTRVDGAPTVFVRVGDGAVQPRRVELGSEDAEKVAVVAGLTVGETVVTRGVLALKAEVFR
jgi:cobalt-zinc-cadmium efflux system membrane fusion protein